MSSPISIPRTDGFQSPALAASAIVAKPRFEPCRMTIRAATHFSGSQNLVVLHCVYPLSVDLRIANHDFLA